jgi:hypothetical protein
MTSADLPYGDRFNAYEPFNPTMIYCDYVDIAGTVFWIGPKQNALIAFKYDRYHTPHIYLFFIF